MKLKQLRTALWYYGLLVLCIVALSGSALCQDIKVDQTSDDCDQQNSLKVQGRTIPFGVTKRVELPALTNEVFWFCSGDRNRSASDFFFNVVKIRREHSTDEFKVFFINSRPPKPGGNQPDVTKVGTTKDGCDGDRHVRFKGKDGNVTVKAGKSSDLIELGSERNQIDWFCVPPSGDCPKDDVCDEHSANSHAFDFVQLERADNGAMNWIFYQRKNSVQAGEPAVPEFMRNANGNVRVAISTPLGKTNKSLPERGLKTALDRGYSTADTLIEAFVSGRLKEEGDAAAKKMGAKFRLDALQISGIQDNELRTAASGKEPSIKYLAHGNSAKIRFILSGIEAKLNVTFDIEAELALEFNPINTPPRAVTAEVRLGHVEIEGSNVFGNLAQEIFKNKLREAKTRANNIVVPFRDEVNKFLEENFPSIPANVAKLDTSVTPAGTMRFCLRVLGASPCVFIAEPVAAHQPKVLDTDVDRCGDGRIWLRDASKRRFVSIAKGNKNVIVEVESREFPWFCGGNQAPEQDESATGPLGTYLIAVSRAPTGDRIDWKFMFWR
jgi:hypothetical protein